MTNIHIIMSVSVPEMCVQNLKVTAWMHDAVVMELLKACEIFWLQYGSSNFNSDFLSFTFWHLININ